ncbi:F0F1 ATP synthase subunit B [Clostridium fallax]|uniref:ATP synthase subunit b n=1 Tax=Clostridium fallax TaxID=1533 RepID=A0A1M4VF70_9CLOT|nr:F0F1 ATP synthase subunit B [Clostridium fallax]SHE67646.1 ATP synthase F0 subcomplex B subunit [Clostridium fallax]SQB05744.1 F0F1 ATP synthase subunit B [Clostridium fallax]
MESINFLTILAAILNFIILYAILRHFFFDKVKKVVNDRQESIENKLLEADEDAEKARMMLLENERILKSAKQEGKAIKEKEKKKAEKIYQEIVEDANKEAHAILERSKVEINREKAKAEDEVKKQAVDLALMLSAKALEESIDEEKHRKLINDYISKVGI